MKKWRKAVPLIVIIGISVTPPTWAQVVVGGSRPEVEVDTSVLDALGNEPTLPDLLQGRGPGLGQGALRHGTAPISQIAKRNARHTALPTGLRSAGEVIVLRRPPHKGHEKAEPISTSVSIDPNQIRPAQPSFPPAEAPIDRPAAGPIKLIRPHRHPMRAATKASTEAAAPTPAEPGATARRPPAFKTAALPPVAEPAAPTAPAPEPAKPALTAPPVAQTPPPTAAPTTAAPPTVAPATTAPAPTEPTVASVPTPAPESVDAKPTAVLFAKDDSRLNDKARMLLGPLAKRLTTDDGLEIELLAYAAGDEDHASGARKLSLSRALAIRSFLVEQGIRSTRIEVRALGNKVPDGPPDRVDLVVQKRS